MSDRRMRLRITGMVAAAVLGIASATTLAAPSAVAATYPGGCNKWIGTDGKAYAEARREP